METEDREAKFPVPSTRISPEEKLIKAREYKQAGNDLYKQKLYRDAMKKYHRALLFVKGIEADASGLASRIGLGGVTDDLKVSDRVQREVKAIKVDCYNNLAAAALQLESPNYEKIVSYCGNVLEENGANSKAWFRQGQAWLKLRDFEKALNCFTNAEKHQSQPDPSIAKNITLCHQELGRVKEKEKMIYSQMFRQK